MNYWEGVMNWPIDSDWECEVCGMVPPRSLVEFLMKRQPSLVWGFVNGTCRCGVCHTQYAMRDYDAEGKPPVTRPICRLKPEYKAAFIKLWAEHHRPVDQITDEEWKVAGVVLEIPAG